MPGLLARLGLRLLAQREPAPRQDLAAAPPPACRTGPCPASAARATRVTSAAAADAGVVAGGDPARRRSRSANAASAANRNDAVAAHARVGRAPGAVLGDELLHHLVVELLAQVEADVRHPERVAGRPRRAHRLRRAAGALAVGRAGVDPQPQGDADRLEAGLDRLQQRDRASRRRPTSPRRRACGSIGHRRAESSARRERPAQGIDGDQHALAVGSAGAEHRLHVGLPIAAASSGSRPSARRTDELRPPPSRAGSRSCGAGRARCGRRRARARSGSRSPQAVFPASPATRPVRPTRPGAGRARARWWRRSTRREA